MDGPRIVLDGLSMSLLFNAVAGLGILLFPQAYGAMIPKEIREGAAPYVDPKDVRSMKRILCPLYLFMSAYRAVSERFTGTEGFRPLFRTGYEEGLLRRGIPVPRGMGLNGADRGGSEREG